MGTLPLARQPGERWLYQTGADVLGVLLARAADQPFETVLRERIFEPLGMRDTAFWVPPADLERLGPCFVTNPESGGRDVYDPPDGQWSRTPDFQGAGDGLVSTIDDYLAFAEMLRSGGAAPGGRIVSRPSIETMTTNQLTAENLAVSGPDPSGDLGWGFGVGVQIRRSRPTRPVGSYGWDGGLGSSWANDPTEDLIGIVLTNQMWDSPTPPAACQDFWTGVYAAIDD
jgi:CubicO group peptidase (beta-lactamase class C family)